MWEHERTQLLKQQQRLVTLIPRNPFSEGGIRLVVIREVFHGDIYDDNDNDKQFIFRHVYHKRYTPHVQCQR